MILAIYTMGGCAEHYLYNTPVEKVLKESLGRRDGSEGFAAWWEILQRSQVGSNVTACAPLVSGSTALRNHKAAFDWARRGVVLFSPLISDNACFCAPGSDWLIC